MQLNELMPAVNAAEKTVKLNPSWWVGHQTLGRTLLNIGEVKMALSSFKRALHLNPTDEELWEVDLKWTLELIEKKNSTETKLSAENSNYSKMVITEFKDLSDLDQNHSTSEKSLQIFKPKSTDLNADSVNNDNMTELPDSYVLMR
ncbi:hypothetical protein HELRODRAFT_101226 [Helobdella robusta]|uniref:Uncharacterized protein n=1 Tax=Helobdella robusta TaxID=6412 RepID=T1ED36_HELRO|nr:hypothetical protein HELRODRAFT_101226 [Helobdella robusta]ESN99938.1 hypothetical protein HELRODRAFT_101226 [Helobdella robusta]